MLPALCLCFIERNARSQNLHFDRVAIGARPACRPRVTNGAPAVGLRVQSITATFALGNPRAIKSVLYPIDLHGAQKVSQFFERSPIANSGCSRKLCLSNAEFTDALRRRRTVSVCLRGQSGTLRLPVRLCNRLCGRAGGRSANNGGARPRGSGGASPYRRYSRFIRERDPTGRVQSGTLRLRVGALPQSLPSEAYKRFDTAREYYLLTLRR
jgi:hypothetical protein